jgi:electron transfer flavoprotein alpha subunit
LSIDDGRVTTSEASIEGEAPAALLTEGGDASPNDCGILGGEKGMSLANHIVVFLEPPGERRDDLNRGLVTEGARIARLTGGRVIALTVGSPAVEADQIEGYGATELIEISGRGLLHYTGEAFAWAIAKVLGDIPFRLLLLGHTDRGRELAPRVAARLASAAVTDCTDIRVRDGSLFYTRHVYGGQFEQEVRYGLPVCEVASIRTEGLYRRKVAPSPAPLEVVRTSVEIPADLRVPRPLDTQPPDYRTVDILYARRLIGVGFGAVESLEPVEELAHLLGASIAATRPVVDDGLIPKTRMIGQTGKTVAPDLYVALGISGSPHHVAGMQESEKVLSVNVDPRAPMVAFSDMAFVGDLRSLLPKLVERIRRHRNGESR